MITRSDLNEEKFEQMIRHELLEQLAVLEYSDTQEDTVLIEALKRVIAYNSVPGTYENGRYDN